MKLIYFTVSWKRDLSQEIIGFFLNNLLAIYFFLWKKLLNA